MYHVTKFISVLYNTTAVRKWFIRGKNHFTRILRRIATSFASNGETESTGSSRASRNFLATTGSTVFQIPSVCIATTCSARRSRETRSTGATRVHPVYRCPAHDVQCALLAALLSGNATWECNNRSNTSLYKFHLTLHILLIMLIFYQLM